MKRRTFLKVFGIGIGAAATGQVGAIEFEQELPEPDVKIDLDPDNKQFIGKGPIKYWPGKGDEIKFKSEHENTGISEGGYIVPQEIADQITSQLNKINAFGIQTKHKVKL